MSFAPPDGPNPFEAPHAEIGERAFDFGEDAELIRRFHLGRERAVRAIGLLSYLVAAIAGLFAGFSLLVAAGVIAPGRGLEPAMARLQATLFLLGLAFYGMIAVAAAALGVGLRRLQAWARWTGMVLAMIALLYLLGMAAVILAILPAPNSFAASGFFLSFAAILGYVFYLLVTPRAGVVFSPEYRDVIARTPEIRAGFGRPAKIAAGLAIGVMLLLVLTALLSG